MLERLQLARTRCWSWFSARAHGKHALFWLIVLSILEPFISFIVPETLLVPILLAGSKRWKFYAFVSSAACAVGSVIGYFVGAYFFELVGRRLIELYGLQEHFVRAQMVMEEHLFAAMFTASFTPLPDKVFVLAAGFFGASFLPYLLGFIVGRSLRIYLIAFLVHRFGAHVIRLLERYFLGATLLLTLMLAILIARSLLL